MPRSFRTQAAFRAWLQKNHASETELPLRLFKVHAKSRGIGYKEALDEALCFGWIDGVRHALDEDSFTVRFTPRKPKSKWSQVNIKRVGELESAGLMHASGLAAFRAGAHARRSLFLRKQISHTRRRGHQAASRQQVRLGILSSPAALVPSHHRLLDQECQTRRNPRQTPRPAHRPLCQRQNPSRAGEEEVKRSTPT